MLFIRPIGSESVYWESTFEHFSWLDSSSLRVVVLKRFPRDSFEYGFPPSNGKRNSVGDRSCSHVNVVGSLDLHNTAIIDHHNVTKNIDTVIPVFCPDRVVTQDDRAYFEFGRSYSYHAPDTIKVETSVFLKNYTDIHYQVVSDDVHLLATSTWTTKLWYDDRVVDQTISSASFEITLGKRSTVNPNKFVGTTVSFKTNTMSSPHTYQSDSFGQCSEPNLDELALDHSIGEFVVSAIRSRPPLSRDLEGLVALDAVNNCHTLDLNMIAFGLDVKNIRRIGDALRSVTEIRDSKTLANAYLSNHYGTKLFLSDAITLISAITKHRKKTIFRGTSIARAQRSLTVPITSGSLSGYQWTTKCNVKLYYEPFDAPMKALVQRLYDIDVYPSYQNLWDLIPYSFVVDWFVDVERWMEARDAENYLEQIATKSVCISHRDSIIGIPASLISSELRGTFDFILYDRRCRPVLPEMPTSLSLKPLNGFQHWWEGAALLRQRVR